MSVLENGKHSFPLIATKLDNQYGNKNDLSFALSLSAVLHLPTQLLVNNTFQK